MGRAIGVTNQPMNALATQPAGVLTKQELGGFKIA